MTDNLTIKSTSLISVFVVFYWFTQVFFYSNSLNRFILIVPSVILSGIIFYLLLSKKNLKFKRSSYLLIAFFLGSLFTGLYNAEIEIIAVTAIFTFPLIAVNENLFSIDLRLVNFLFISTIVIGIISYHLGYNEYGYLPGHSYLNGKTPWWRVSIFPTSTPTVSSFFSLLIYIYNINGKSFRSKILKGLSVYFLVLSGSRTAILLFVAILIYRYIKNKKIRHFLPYIFLLLPIIVLSSQLIFKLSGSEIGREYILRGKSYNSQEAVDNYVRFELWSNLISLYRKNPILGLGSFNLLDYFPHAASYSESKWLTLFVSNGISTILLVCFCVFKYYKAVIYDKTFEAMGILILIISMFYYGSFYNPYNIIYFLNILLFSNINKVYD